MISQLAEFEEQAGAVGLAGGILSCWVGGISGKSKGIEVRPWEPGEARSCQGQT